jgi:hypothetical protein
VGGAARTELLRTDGQTEQLRAVLLGRTDGRSCSDGAAAGGAAADGRTELLRAELLRTDGRAELLGRSCCGRSCGHQRGARPELRTPAREIQRQAAGGCEREAESSGSWKCAVTQSLTPFFLP